MDAGALKNALKKRAEELGFDSFGVAAALDVEPGRAEALRERLSKGMHDEMLYLERNIEKRLSPALLFPPAKSIIVVAAGYYRTSPARRIALYAQGPDYHSVIKDKLFDLQKILAANGFLQKVCVDTAPIMEKYFASLAGLGWIGKNTLLINQKNGPWNFLGVVLTSAVLEPDNPQRQRCGNCTRCIDACPGRALAPYALDARRCISNLTIERRTPLSEEEQKLCGDKIFGCDECLRACPFGKSAPVSGIAEFNETITLPDRTSHEDALKLISSKRAQNLTLRRK